MVSGKIRGQTATMPITIEMLYNEYLSVAAFSMAALLTALALVTLLLKTLLELRHADQLPAVARSPVDRLLQGGLRGDTLANVQRSVLRVVALSLRTVGSLPLFLGHVFPPFFGLPSGNLFHTNMMPPTGARRTSQRSSRLLPSCTYNVTVLYHGDVR